MSTTTADKTSENKPLAWIHLELIPLPDKVEDYTPCVVWWNPDSGEIVGEQAEAVISIIKHQQQQGSVTNTLGTVELTDPFTKPTELASILGLFYWVVPVPVAKPFEKVEAETGSSNPANSPLH